MTRRVPFWQVDVFTRERFQGNPAGVVPDARGLADAEMRAIARELANPETAFVVGGTPDGSEVEVRFFSPSVEVPLCGHASLATHWVRAREDGEGPRSVRQRSPGGAWDVEVEDREDGHGRVWLIQAPVRFGEPLASADRGELLEALGLDEATLDPRVPVVPVDTGHAKVLVGVDSAETLDGLEPDMGGLLAFQHHTGRDGVQVFTLDVAEPGVDVESRMFAPALGIPEDPVTGSGQGPLGALLVREGLASCWDPSRPKTEIVSRQGRAMGRPGTAFLRVECRGGEPVRVRVGGEAVCAFRGELEL